MATSLPEDALVAVKDLVRHLLGLQDVSSNSFKLAENRILTTLKNSDSMYFLNTKDIQRDIDSMADKFMFHSFFRHAEKLKRAHENYISSTSSNKLLSKSELTAKLNIVKFLLCMSESPTSHFCDSPQDFDFVYEEESAEEEVIDWGAYLNEGINRWSPGQDEDNPDLLSDLSDDDSEDLLNPATADGAITSVASSQTSQMTIPMQEKEDAYSFQESRSQLLEIIQQNWYNTAYNDCAPDDDGYSNSRNSICETPPSGHFQANVGILWDKYLQEQAKGLINVKPANVFSEYKVLREILWQMWGPHRSAIFDFCDRNRIVVKNEVTIASVRAVAFENFVSDQFLPHIRLLDELRGLNTDLNERHLSETYRSYVAAHQQILGPVMQEIVGIEDDVRRQEHTTTLLIVAQKLDKCLEPVRILKKIHDQVDSDLTITETYTDTPMECTLELVTRLRLGLQFSTNKMEQDIRLALYLSSLKYYLNTVDDWLSKNLLVDYTGEFIIKNNNSDTTLAEDWQMNFELHPVSANYLEKDQILTVIGEDVLQIGRNLHLLRLLGKKYELDDGDNQQNSSTIYEEFLDRFLKALCDYFDVEIDSIIGRNPELDCDKICASAGKDNEMGISGDLENFVDTSDGFLMEAFHGYHSKRIPGETQTLSLFEKISRITASLFPVRTMPEKILSQILKERFLNSGLTVKRILVEDFSLDKLFEFLRHVYLFDEDLIFPFYRRLFEKMDKPNSSWGNSVWLTSHLHDVILDKYSRNAEFYENCIVLVRDYWRECTEASEACSMISVQFGVKWPLNMIVTADHLRKYREVFQFLLKLKWALYTVNRLNFADLEPKKRNQTLPHPKKKNVARENVAKQLKYLRFGLINILNTIQHYVFGYVLTRCRMTFELDFEKASDLKSLLSAHSDFIDLMHAGTVEVRDYERHQAGFVTLMGCVKLVDVMWNNLEHAWPERLETCCRIYRTCFDVISSIVNPTCV